MTYNKEEIRNSLTTKQVFDLLTHLNAEPVMKNGNIIAKTICHGGESHKLYYYSHNKLFHCYTDCGDSFDIFELVKRVNGEGFGLPQAINYIGQYFGFNKSKEKGFNLSLTSESIKYLQDLERIQNIDISAKKIELKEYDAPFLKNFPRPHIIPWEKDQITKEIMDYYEICFNPLNGSVVIPHRDNLGRLVGIRERTLSIEDAERYGKYRPMLLGKQMYNHPLSFNLYGLYQNQENIKRSKIAFVAEGEKSVLQYGSMFGQENNLATAICGSSFTYYQAKLLIDLGVREIIVGLDKQYQELGDAEHTKLVKNLTNIHKKFGNFVTISYLFDKENILNYKSSPTDEGKDKFLYLFRNRINLY